MFVRFRRVRDGGRGLPVGTALPEVIGAGSDDRGYGRGTVVGEAPLSGWLLAGCVAATLGGAPRVPASPPSSRGDTAGSGATGDTAGASPQPACADPDLELAPPECALPPVDGVAFCLPDYAGPIAGSFTGWPDQLAFVRDDGTEAPLIGGIGADPAIPDLGAAGHLTLTQFGGCDPKAGGEATVFVTDDTGATLLVTSTEGDATRGAWRVAPGLSGIEPCASFPNGGCTECRANRSVHLTSTAVDAILWQGQSVDQGGMHVAVSVAFDGGPSNVCESTSNPTAWWAAPL